MGELEQYLVPIRRYSANPCMDCCLPISKCPWLREGKPVPGWTAFDGPPEREETA